LLDFNFYMGPAINGGRTGGHTRKEESRKMLDYESYEIQQVYYSSIWICEGDATRIPLTIGHYSVLFLASLYMAVNYACCA